MASRTILFGIDRSQWAEKAFNFYINNYYDKNIDKLIAVHTLEMPHTFPEAQLPEDFTEVLNKTKNEAEKLVEKWKTLLSMYNGQVLLENGKPGEVIVATALKENASLIVVGSRGLNEIRRTFIGSVSDYVLHHSHCPVLVSKDK